MANFENLLNELKQYSNEINRDDDFSFDLGVCENEVKNNDDTERKNNELDLELKAKYAKHVLSISYIWLSFLIGVFIATGITNIHLDKPYMSDNVLITLISGTSLSIIVGLLSIILKYLFRAKAQK